jgi:hypothetical protein
MKKQKYIILMMIVYFAASYTVDISASGIGKTGSGAPAMNKLAPPVIPPPGPPLFIPYKWSPNDIINIFNKEGLEIKDIKPLTAEDYKSLPARAKEARKFTLSLNGKDAEGCILSFERRDNMQKITDHYRSLNKKGKLFSWTFTKDNVLVVLKGQIPEAKARLYEDALKKLNKKN